MEEICIIGTLLPGRMCGMDFLHCSLQREKPISGMSLTAANFIAASRTTSSTVTGIYCDNVVCWNCHEMIIHIVRGILHDYQDCVREKFATESFSLDDCMELKRMYDTSEINSPAFAYDADPMATAASLSFECNFSKEQMAGIVSCANTCHLFCVPTVRMEDMEALFACKEGFRIRVNNIRHVAVLFDALLERSYIQAYWQSVLERGKFLVSKDGKRIVTASSLSTALSAARIRPTSVVYAIRTMIGQLP